MKNCSCVLASVDKRKRILNEFFTEEVRIWNHKSDRLIASLSGHTGKVNAVIWNPVNPHMLVSCSDDNTVRVWTSNKRS